MDWIEEMKMGMLMIQSACRLNALNDEDCRKCPYAEHCMLVEDETSPANWSFLKELKEKEK